MLMDPSVLWKRKSFFWVASCCYSSHHSKVSKSSEGEEIEWIICLIPEKVRCNEKELWLQLNSSDVLIIVLKSRFGLLHIENINNWSDTLSKARPCFLRHTEKIFNAPLKPNGYLKIPEACLVNFLLLQISVFLNTQTTRTP